MNLPTVPVYIQLKCAHALYTYRVHYLESILLSKTLKLLVVFVCYDNLLHFYARFGFSSLFTAEINSLSTLTTFNLLPASYLSAV